MGFLSNLFKVNKKDTDPYKYYPKDLKEHCEYNDKYQSLFNSICFYTEQINSLYSDFINTKSEKSFNELLLYCQKYIELLPQLEEAHKEDTRINGNVYPSKYCLPYHKLAMAYEKAECYNSAINVCQEAINLGYEDGTKGGFSARLKRLKEKQNKIMHT